MGADITFFSLKNGDGQKWYFRDNYNNTNLAWVIGKSYWTESLNDNLELVKKYFKALARITDKQIFEYVDGLKDVEENNICSQKTELKKILEEKRDNVIKHLPFILKAKSVDWNV